jgi:phage terminase large subunit GpA-like protein
MMDSFCQPEVEKVTILKSARIGYTKIIGHVVGYHIHQDPCSVLIVQPTIDDAEGYSKEEIQPTFDETEVLRKRVGDSKSRSSGNTIAKKKYPGGILHIIGANSPRGFRRITVRLVLFDEVDGYPPSAGQEGDQIKLGIKRSETFWNRKIGLGSTPTNKGISRIGDSWDKSDKGYFVLSCPHCAGEHIRLFSEPDKPVMLRDKPLKASFIKWIDEDPKTAKWLCPDCGALIDHGYHHEMVSAGRWKGETWEWSNDRGFRFELNFTGHIGFRIWSGYSYSPNSTPPKLVREFLECKEDSELLKTFVNTVLGEEWEERGEAANENLLKLRAEKYTDVPVKGLILTAGFDVQADRIEGEVVAWAEDGESWSVEYMVLAGETTQPEVWEDLAEALKTTYKHESGQQMLIESVCIDSGYLPRRVYDFVRKFGARYVYPIKGMPGAGRPIVESITARARRLSKRKSTRIKPEMIGTHEAKILVMRRLKLNQIGPGFCHFPDDRSEEYFKQLTAEKLVNRKKKGVVYQEWVQVRTRNEALDCRVYAHAALLLADPDWGRLISGERKPKPKRKGKAKPYAQVRNLIR